MLQALLNVVLGMGTVFLVLIIICLIIYSFQIFPYLEKKKSQRAANKTDIGQDNTEIGADVSDNQTVPSMEDAAVVAAITAAISAYSHTSQDGFVVKSIVRRKGKE